MSEDSKQPSDSGSVASHCYRDLSICGVPYRLTIVEGGAMFSNKSGFWGVSGRFMFEYAGMLWYLVGAESTWNRVPAAHLAKMHEKLGEYIGTDHTEANGSVFELRFKRD